MEEQKRNPAQGLSESEQVQVRRQKLADLQAAGHDPFTLTKFPQDAYSADLKEEFKELPNETDSGKHVALAGRMMSKRVMGKASFAHLRDDKGDIQLYVRRDELGEESYAAFKKLDVGDIIGVKGEVFRTKTGELSVRAEELTLLAKSLRPLPEKFHGLTDTEMRYRQRYVDLIANPDVKATFVKRSQILKEIRAYLDEKGFLEVDTPILTPLRDRCLRPAVLYPSQYPEHGYGAAHRDRAVPQAPDRGRHGPRVRSGPHLPQRGHGPHPQPGVHLH